MTTATTVILTAIKFKGLHAVRAGAASLADELLCSKSHVMSVCKKVETRKIVIQ